MKSLIVLLSSALALLSLSAHAQAKPKIAVLGLEVIDSGGIDKEATEAAQRLADELRSLASLSESRYALAPNSAKDLLELKLLSDCSDEGRGCMAAIGKDLGADRLLYGKIERKGKGYRVSLKLLNTATRQMEKTTSDLIPMADVTSSEITTWARSLYARLTGVPETGSLSIDANVDKATIYVDGNVATTLRGGSAKVLGLSEGTHKVTIDAEGYQRYESDIAIRAAGNEDLSVSLLPVGQVSMDDDSSDSGRAWKLAFIGGVVTTGGMAAGWTYHGVRVLGELEDNKNDAFVAMQGTDAYESITSGASGTRIDDTCSKAKAYSGPNDPRLQDFLDACAAGEREASRANLYIAGTAIAALATAYFGYQGWVVHGGKSDKEHARREKKKKRRVIVTPQFSTDSVGAGLSLEF